MNEGQVLATGSPAEIRAQASETTLERAFVALLPAGEREYEVIAITYPAS